MVQGCFVDRAWLAEHCMLTAGEKGCFWVLWGNTMSYMCEREKERTSVPKHSNSSGVRCGSCLPAQSNSAQRFWRGNEERCTGLKLQGGF